MQNGFCAAMERVRRGDLPLSGLVAETTIIQLCQRAGYYSQASLYTPVVTVLTWLAQLISNRRCCQKAVQGLIAHRIAFGQEACSADTGGYCKARSRLPEEASWELLRHTGTEIEKEAPEEWLWQGHRVRVADGSTARIADTPANRREYPLQRGLQPGLSFPVVRIMVVFSLAVGSVLDAALNPYRGKGTGETSMLRALAHCFAAGDVLLADRFFAGYYDIAWWQKRGVEVVVRNSASRTSDFRRGKRLGKDDHLIEWRRPARPEWLTAQETLAFPSHLTLREIRVRVEQPGFRTKVLIVITTLLDPEIYSHDALAELYRRRWQAELNLRSLKTHMQMEQLTCKRPEMVRKEFAMYLTAYNLIRRVAAAAAHSLGKSRQPWQVSFQGARDAINEFFPRMHVSRTRAHWLQTLLNTTAQIQVGHRPDRVEPYVIKTRRKEFPPPKQTRRAYRNQFR